MKSIHYLFCLLIYLVTINFSIHAQSYKKTDLLSSDNGDGTFTNPFLFADYPDPDIIKVGSDFYMASSSFTSMPGVPICHSKDLINWKIIGHAYDSITFQPEYRMQNGVAAYRGGTWAPTLRYHNGKFYVGIWSPKDGFMICIAEKPEGPYTMTTLNGANLYDPGLFFDDDGKVYVAHGPEQVYLTELTSDAKGIKTPAKLLFKSLDEKPIEGAHMYKKNGYYYIFTTGHGYNGVELVSRSKSIYGPYETKFLVYQDGMNYADAGVHQGGFVDAMDGSSWFFMFQDRDYLGRDPVLQPMRWVNDWPVLGDPANGNKLVSTWQKPVKGNFSYSFPQTSDEFNKPDLGNHWEFNHIPIKSNWSLTEHPNFLRIKGNYAPDYWHARNTLTQKIPGNVSTATVKVILTGLKEGDFGGIGVFGFPYAQIGVKKLKNGNYIVMEKLDTLIAMKKIEQDIVYLRVDITAKGIAILKYSLDNRVFTALGDELILKFTVKTFLGNRFGLFCYQAQKDKPSGFIEYDWFRLEGTRRGNHYNALQTVSAALYDNERGIKLVRPLPKRPMQYVADIDSGDWLCYNNLEMNHPVSKIILKFASTSPGLQIELRKNSEKGDLLGVFPIASTGSLNTFKSEVFEIKKYTGGEKLYLVFKGKESGSINLDSFSFK